MQTLSLLKIQDWRKPTVEELQQDIQNLKDKDVGRKKSFLVVRQYISPVDIYCYLKARFGEPNGFQNIFKSEDSDNWIQWHYTVMVESGPLQFCGTNRDTHIIAPGQLTHSDWQDLILVIKNDFGRLGKEKSDVLKTLEPWVIFTNRYMQTSGVCAELHSEIIENIDGYQVFKVSSPKEENEKVVDITSLDQIRNRANILYRNCLELSLLTPVLAECFINMFILILCKPEIRSNQRHFSTFIRSPIDAKIFDLPYKCNGLKEIIDPEADAYKNFKRVMDKRNDLIHGNTNPEAEFIEKIYFDKKIPLPKIPGDNIGLYFESLERQYNPKGVLEDYEIIQMFMEYLFDLLNPSLKEDVRMVIEDSQPGFDLNRRIVGKLFPEHLVIGVMQDTLYDDQLKVKWV